MDQYLIKMQSNIINDLKSANRRSSLSLSQSAKKHNPPIQNSVKSNKSKRYSIAGINGHRSCNDLATINPRDAVLKKYFDGAKCNDVSRQTPLSTNHNEMSSLVGDIENISPASPLARSLSQLTMDNKTPEGSGKINFNTITPKQNPYFDKINRDLNSPSATVRLRALQALKSPSKIKNYCGYDIPAEEIDIITEEERKSPEKPKTIQEIMKDVIVYVEVRSGVDNRSAGIKNIMHLLGATVNDKLFRNTTHVIFKGGLLSTYNKAKRWNIPMVSILWVEACKKFRRLMNPKYYPITDLDIYENPDPKIPKYKSMQPVVESIIKSSKAIVKKKVDKVCEPNSDNSDEADDDVFEPKISKKMSRKNILDVSIKSCDEIIDSISNNLQHLSQKSDSETNSDIFVQDPDQINNTGSRMNLRNDSNVTIRRSRRNSSIYSSIVNRDCSTPIQEKIPSCPYRTNYDRDMDISTDKTIQVDTKNNTDYVIRSMDESNQNLAQAPASVTKRRTLYTPKYNEVDVNAENDRNSKTPTTSLSSIQKKHIRRTIIGLPRPTRKSDIFNPHLDISIEQQLDDSKKPLDKISVVTSSVKRRRTLYTPQSYSFDTNSDDIDQNSVDSESKKNKEKELSKLIAERKKLRRSLFPISNYTSTNSIENKCNTPESKSDKKTEEIPIPPAPLVPSLTLPPTGAIKKRKLYKSSQFNEVDLNKSVHVATPQKSSISITPIAKTTSRRSTLEFEMKPKIQVGRPSPKTSLITVKKQREQVMVLTNMHKSQIDVVKEAIKHLGRFKLQQTVTNRTTHLVSLEPKRTINMLRGIIRGVWILNFDYINDSIKVGHWLREEFYELKDFSKAVQLCRTERQAFEGEYKIDLFQDIEPIFISPKSTIPVHYLRELIVSCSGQWTDNIMKARYVLGEKFHNENVLCLNPLWILDSIQENKIMKISKYVLRYDNEK